MLKLPHHQQLDDGYCLPACVQMILAFYGIERSQEELAKIFGVRRALGTPFSRVQNLSIRNMRVEFGSGDIADLSARLRQGIPVIVRVMTDDLPYWDFGTSHVIIVQDIDEASITLNDPAFAESSFTVSLGDFQLAWLAADNSFASIIRI